MKQVTSAQNAYYKEVKKLIFQKNRRLESGLFVTEGKRLFQDAFESGLRPEAVLLGQTLAHHAQGEYERICGNVYVLPDTLLDALSDTYTPQGVLGVFPFPQEQSGLEGEKLVLLHSLQDPGNVGTILRTALALGVDRVLLTRDCPDLYAPKTLRASMGAVLRMKSSVVENGAATIQTLRGRGVSVLAAALCPDARDVGKFCWEGPCCVVIGNEGNGLSPETIACCDGTVTIPMRDGAQSLNAAMAAGILIWEMTKK